MAKSSNIIVGAVVVGAAGFAAWKWVLPKLRDAQNTKATKPDAPTAGKPPTSSSSDGQKGGLLGGLGTVIGESVDGLKILEPLRSFGLISSGREEPGKVDFQQASLDLE